MPLGRFRKKVLATLTLCLTLGSTGAAATDVVVSIKPLELLVRAVATPDINVTTLVPPGTNPHNYSMKPSQRRALDEADAVFWVGPAMETFLQSLLSGSEFQSRSHALGPENDEDSHQSEEGHHHDHHSHDEGQDPHVWLDPEYARDMVHHIHQTLAQLPGADKEALKDNLAAFEKALTATEQEIDRQLEPARKLSLFTYHNAFSHFAEHFNLTLTGVLAVNPEVSPGARHLAKIQKRLNSVSQPCIMTEQPFDPGAWQAIIGDSGASISAWDPLAADIPPGPDGYVVFQKSLADAVLQCL